MKLKVHIFQIKSFLPPSKVFYPPFLLLKHPLFKKQSKTWFCWIFVCSKKGVKNFWGGKNFWFEKYGPSASFCTKNHKKSSKTRKNRFSSKLTKKGFFFGIKTPFQSKFRSHPLKIQPEMKRFTALQLEAYWSASKCWLRASIKILVRNSAIFYFFWKCWLRASMFVFGQHKGPYVVDRATMLLHSRPLVNTVTALSQHS